MPDKTIAEHLTDMATNLSGILEDCKTSLGNKNVSTDNSTTLSDISDKIDEITTGSGSITIEDSEGNPVTLSSDTTADPSEVKQGETFIQYDQTNNKFIQTTGTMNITQRTSSNITITPGSTITVSGLAGQYQSIYKTVSAPSASFSDGVYNNLASNGNVYVKIPISTAGWVSSDQYVWVNLNDNPTGSGLKAENIVSGATILGIRGNGGSSSSSSSTLYTDSGSISSAAKGDGTFEWRQSISMHDHPFLVILKDYNNTAPLSSINGMIFCFSAPPSVISWIQVYYKSSTMGPSTYTTWNAFYNACGITAVSITKTQLYINSDPNAGSFLNSDTVLSYNIFSL